MKNPRVDSIWYGCRYPTKGNDDLPRRYDWVKVATPVSDADKALVTEMWCSETTLEGRPVLDGKVFK